MKRVAIKITLGLCIPVIVYILYGFIRTYQESNIYEIKFHGNNPTEYVFPYPIDSVEKVIKNLCWRDFKTFMELENRSIPERKYYYYSPLAPTGSYVFRYKKAKYNPVWHSYDQTIELSSASEDSTKVVVKNKNQSRIAGVKYWGSLKFERNYLPKEVHAESTTIEEYEILRYIGKNLGYIDQMPYVQYPPELSKEDILYAFGANPFSLKEMFEDASDTTVLGRKYEIY